MKVFDKAPIPVAKLHPYGETLVALNNLTQSYAFEATKDPITFKLESDIPEVNLALAIKKHELAKGAMAHKETKADLGLELVDNFKLANNKTVFSYSDKLYVNPSAIGAVIGNGKLTFNEDNYLQKGSIPIATGNEYLMPANYNSYLPTEGVINNSLFPNDNQDNLKDRYFKGVGQVYLNFDRIIVTPQLLEGKGVTQNDLLRAESYTSTPLLNDQKLKFKQDRINAPLFPYNAGFNSQFIGSKYGALKAQELAEDSVTFLSPNTKGEPVFRIGAKTNNGTIIGIDRSFSNADNKFFRLSISKYYQDKNEFFYGGGGVAPLIVYNKINGTVQNIENSKHVSFFIKDIINIEDGIDYQILGSDSGVIPNISCCWEQQDKSLLLLVQFLLKVTIDNNSTNYIIKLGLRLMIDDVNFVLSHLPQQKMGVLKRDGGHVSGNTIFKEEDFLNSPFHPNFATGQFSPLGGHYSAYANLSGFELGVKYFKHTITNISDYILNYHALPVITDTTVMHIPKYTHGCFPHHTTRFLPIDGNTIYTVELVDGVYKPRKYIWDNGIVIKEDGASKKYVTEPTDIIDNIERLPLGLVSIIENDTNNFNYYLTSLILEEGNNYLAKINFNVNNPDELQPSIRLANLTKLFLDGKLNGDFKQELREHFTLNDDTDKGKYEFKVYLLEKAEGYDCFIIFTDTLSGAAIYTATCAKTEHQEIELTDLTKVYIGFTSGYPTEFLRDDVETYDIFTYHDLLVQSNKQTNKTVMLFTNVLGEFGGDIFVGISDWTPFSQSSLASAVKVGCDNLHIVKHPVAKYGYVLRGKMSNRISIANDTFMLSATALNKDTNASDPHGIYTAMPCLDYDLSKFYNYAYYNREVKHEYILPANTRVALNGKFYTLGKDTFFTPSPKTITPEFVKSKLNKFNLTINDRGELIYLVLKDGKLSVLLTSTPRTPSVYEVFYGVAVFDTNNKLSVNLYNSYVVADNVQIN